MIRPHLRIAVLECDTPIGNTQQKYGSYGGLFEFLLLRSAAHLSQNDHIREPTLAITKYDVVGEPDKYPSLDNIDAVLLSGSKHNSFDSHPWILTLLSFVREILSQHRVRLLGVCFGHQIIGRALEVDVDRSDRGWEVAVVPVELTPRGKEVFGLDRLVRLTSDWQRGTSRLTLRGQNIHQMHRDIVYTLPAGVEALGRTPRCEVQGMYVQGRLLTVQGHPEFDGEIEEELIQRRYEQGVFDMGMYKDAMGRVRREHDGVVVGAAFLRFLLE